MRNSLPLGIAIQFIVLKVGRMDHLDIRQIRARQSESKHPGPPDGSMPSARRFAANGVEVPEAASPSRSASPDGTTLCTINSGRLTSDGVRTGDDQIDRGQNRSAFVGAVTRHTVSTRTGCGPDARRRPPNRALARNGPRGQRARPRRNAQQSGRRQMLPGNRHPFSPSAGRVRSTAASNPSNRTVAVVPPDCQNVCRMWRGSSGQQKKPRRSRRSETAGPEQRRGNSPDNTNFQSLVYSPPKNFVHNALTAGD